MGATLEPNRNQREPDRTGWVQNGNEPNRNRRLFEPNRTEPDECLFKPNRTAACWNRIDEDANRTQPNRNHPGIQRIRKDFELELIFIRNSKN